MLMEKAKSAVDTTRSNNSPCSSLLCCWGTDEKLRQRAQAWLVNNKMAIAINTAAITVSTMFV